jgi:hypothetical protein
VATLTFKNNQQSSFLLSPPPIFPGLGGEAYNDRVMEKNVQPLVEKIVVTAHSFMISYFPTVLIKKCTI